MRSLVAPLLLLGCASQRASEPKCAPIEGIDQILDRSEVLLFGEMHGTVEMPRAFGEVVCHLLSRRGRAIVGLGISHREQQRFDAFLAATSTSVLSGAHWTSTYQDGRASRAMLELVESLRRMRETGVRIELVAFDPLPDVAPEQREERLAENLARAREAGAPLVVLTGNIHPWTVRGAPWDPAFEPMGYRLVERGIEVLSIELRHAGGTAWICTGASPDTCGVQTIASPSSPKRQLELFSTRNEHGYGGALGLGSIQASPPAKITPPLRSIRSESTGRSMAGRRGLR